MKVAKYIGMLFVFSIVGAVSLFFYGTGIFKGSFVKWEPLGKPPGKVIKILEPGYVEAETGEIYQYVVKVGCGDECWVLSDNTLRDYDDSLYLRELPLSECANFPSLDNYVKSKAACELWMTGKSLSIYAIDDNGFVYSWYHKIADGYDVWVRKLFPFVGAFLGFFVGLIVLLLYLFFNFLKKAFNDEWQEG